MTETQPAAFMLNGTPVEQRTPGDETLLTTLRERLGITSVRQSCGIGMCGTCTVLVDGKAVSSCLQLTQMVTGSAVTTAEGLVDDTGRLAPAQEAFVRRRAFQCSFCIPAMALTLHAALEARPDASRDDLLHELGGNLCRCGSYPQVREAIDDLVDGRRSDTGRGH